LAAVLLTVKIVVLYCIGLVVDVAQLVERRFVVPDVAGSSPVFHPIYNLTRGTEGIENQAQDSIKEKIYKRRLQIARLLDVNANKMMT
jgi:hypothetical protein